MPRTQGRFDVCKRSLHAISHVCRAIVWPLTTCPLRCRRSRCGFLYFAVCLDLIPMCRPVRVRRSLRSCSEHSHACKCRGSGAPPAFASLGDDGTAPAARSGSKTQHRLARLLLRLARRRLVEARSDALPEVGARLKASRLAWNARLRQKRAHVRQGGTAARLSPCVSGSMPTRDSAWRHSSGGTSLPCEKASTSQAAQANSAERAGVARRRLCSHGRRRHLRHRRCIRLAAASPAAIVSTSVSADRTSTDADTS